MPVREWEEVQEVLWGVAGFGGIDIADLVIRNRSMLKDRSSSNVGSAPAVEGSVAPGANDRINLRIDTDQRMFVLDATRYDMLTHVLDNPPVPAPKLRALLRRVPAWEK